MKSCLKKMIERLSKLEIMKSEIYEEIPDRYVNAWLQDYI